MKNYKKIIVTGGSGFIGSALIRYIIQNTDHTVVNIDKLTYAGNTASLISIEDSQRYTFENIDICDAKKIRDAFDKYQPDLIIHLAAESHVDRSINSPRNFIDTNIIGTYTLLEISRMYWKSLDAKKRKFFRFHHVSTDEVYGDLGRTDDLFDEESRYEPSSPYSASKASSDHLVRAWGRTFGLPFVITNCSNNYGPYQYPEKLIPIVILNALEGKKIPVYGNGNQIRDWIFVKDHVNALLQVALVGKIGETYNIGGDCQIRNIEIVKKICSILDEVKPSKFKGVAKYHELIHHVQDRAGHDIRYAIDSSKIQKELNYKPKYSFDKGLRKTVLWYLNNQAWIQSFKINDERK